MPTEDTTWLALPIHGTPPGAELNAPRQLFLPQGAPQPGKPIVAASPFQVALLSCVVADDLDGFLRGKNDVLITSNASMGDQPQVERIHFYEEEIPAGKPIRSLLAENIYLCDDYNGADRLRFEIKIVEVDRNAGQRDQIISAFSSLAATAGAVFPAIAPYAFAASAVVSAVGALIRSLEKDDQVMSTAAAFYPAISSGYARMPLQEGVYVNFARAVAADQYILQPNGLVTTSNGRPSTVSYVVYDVRRHATPNPRFIINQKLATLLTQTEKGNEAAVADTLSFLRDTMTAYANFKKLQRYSGLATQSKRSPEEEALLKQIGEIEALKPFLPQA